MATTKKPAAASTRATAKTAAATAKAPRGGKAAAPAVRKKPAASPQVTPAVQVQVVTIMILAFFFLLFAVARYT